MITERKQQYSAQPSWMLVVLIIAMLWVPKSSAALEYFRYSLFACLSLYFIISAKFGGIRDLSRSLFFVFYLFLCVSVLWSETVVFSLIRIILVSFTICAAFSIVRLYPTRRILSSVCTGLVLFALMGVCAVIFVPSIGVEQTWLHYGKWNGLSTQKNVFALNVVLALIFLLVGRKMYSNLTAKSFGITVVICILAFALFKAGSRSGMLDLAVALGFLVLLHINWRATRIILPMFLIFGGAVVLILLLFVVKIESGVIELGKFSVDTSSRTKIWSFGWDAITQNELQSLWGMGFGGFWTQLRVEQFQSQNGWVIPNFHNGYLSTYFDLGLIGLSLLLMVFLQAGYLFIRHLNSFRTIDGGLIYLIVFVQFSVHNLYENNLMRSTDIAFFLFCLSLAGLYANIQNSYSVNSSRLSKAGVRKSDPI